VAYQFRYSSLEEYHTLGYTVFRQILPPSLIADLRRVTDKARDIARERSGEQAQRLQPVGAYDLDQGPFQDYADLPELVDAIARVLSPRHRHGSRDLFGVLLDPGEMPWCTAWHRDWRDNMPGLDIAMWERSMGDGELFNQINCALYEDNCTWVVPGSHLRLDSPEEQAGFPEGSIPGAKLDGLTYEERERAGLDYCRTMPGAVRLCLDAGDFALYRNTLWHLGNYAPHLKRATLHDSADTPEFAEWRRKAHETRKSA
jgi:hypothetical protein